MPGPPRPNAQSVSCAPDIRDISVLYAEFSESHRYLDDPQDAEGRCRWASLAFADFADCHGISVSLIKWRIVPTSRFAREPYNEHWAIDIGHGRILDPTSAQVGGLTSPWNRLDNYPANYLMPTSVPAHVLLPVYRRWGNVEAKAGKWNPDFMRRLDMLWELETYRPSLLGKAFSICRHAIWLLLFAASLHHLLLT